MEAVKRCVLTARYYGTTGRTISSMSTVYTSPLRTHAIPSLMSTVYTSPLRTHAIPSLMSTVYTSPIQTHAIPSLMSTVYISPLRTHAIPSLISTVCMSPILTHGTHSQPIRYNRHCHQRLFHTSITGTSRMIPDAYQNTSFTKVYRFPYIATARFLARIKLHQTGLTLLGVPLCAWLYSRGDMDAVSVELAAGIASFAGVMLYVMGGFVRKIVGMVHISEDRRTVRISRLTFWGNRCDHYLPVENIQPVMDYCQNPKDVFIPIRTYDSKHTLNMTLRYGQILDKELFQLIFGSINY